MVSCAALDSVVKEVIYEANIYNSNIPEIIDAYTERNKIAVPLLNKLIEIQKQRKKENSPAIREDEENDALYSINKADEKLPTINKENTHNILTEIKNCIITRVKREQITRQLSTLNKKLKNDPNDATRREVLEAKELYNTKYTTYFKRDAAKTTMFKQLNLEKPMKWFLNLASVKLSTDSPANKLRKYCDKNKNTADWGKKYDKKEDMMPSRISLTKDHETRMPL